MTFPVGAGLYDARERNPRICSSRHWHAKQNNAEAAGWAAAPNQFAKIFVKGEYHRPRLKGALDNQFVRRAARNFQDQIHLRARLPKGFNRARRKILISKESHHAAGG